MTHNAFDLNKDILMPMKEFLLFRLKNQFKNKSIIKINQKDLIHLK